jgi:hypothetical protein
VLGLGSPVNDEKGKTGSEHKYTAVASTSFFYYCVTLMGNCVSQTFFCYFRN